MVHASVPCDEQGDKDESSCEKWHAEGGLIEHVEKKARSLAIEAGGSSARGSIFLDS